MDVRGVTVYRVSEFAEKAGVTVRTLHYYDRLGLLKPSGRTDAGYRLYGERDLVRLQQIVTLKFIGMPLREIKDLLNQGDLDLAATLACSASSCRKNGGRWRRPFRPLN